jgi:hypothetical protein
MDWKYCEQPGSDTKNNITVMCGSVEKERIVLDENSRRKETKDWLVEEIV